jgi:hypothetical protein
VFAFAPWKFALPAPQATIDTIDLNVNEQNAGRFFDFLYSHENKLVGLLKARLWSDTGPKFHVDLQGENLSAFVTGVSKVLSCDSCAYYYQTAAVLDGYFLVKTEFHHGNIEIILRKIDEAQVLLSNPRTRPVQLR